MQTVLAGLKNPFACVSAGSGGEPDWARLHHLLALTKTEMVVGQAMVRSQHWPGHMRARSRSEPLWPRL